jgi:hypothetical protein
MRQGIGTILRVKFGSLGKEGDKERRIEQSHKRDQE